MTTAVYRLHSDIQETHNAHDIGKWIVEKLINVGVQAPASFN